MNDSIHSSKQNYEQQILTLKTLITELENQSLFPSSRSISIDRLSSLDQTKSTEFTAKDQQIEAYQSKLDELNRVNNELRQQIEQSQEKLNQFQREITEKQHTQLESTEQVTTLQNTNETLKSELQQWQSKYSDLQNECQKQLTSNEQLKNTTDNIVNEKQAVIDQLTKEINGMQQVQGELIEKQIKQHADFEEQEKVLQEKIQTYEKQIQSMKSTCSLLKDFSILIAILI